MVNVVLVAVAAAVVSVAAALSAAVAVDHPHPVASPAADCGPDPIADYAACVADLSLDGRVVDCRTDSGTVHALRACGRRRQRCSAALRGSLAACVREQLRTVEEREEGLCPAPTGTFQAASLTRSLKGAACSAAVTAAAMRVAVAVAVVLAQAALLDR